MEREKGEIEGQGKRMQNDYSRPHTRKLVGNDLKENQVLNLLRGVKACDGVLELEKMGCEVGLAIDYIASTSVISEKFLRLNKEGQEKAVSIVAKALRNGSFPLEISELTQYLYGYSFTLESRSEL